MALDSYAAGDYASADVTIHESHHHMFMTAGGLADAIAT